MPKVHGGRSPWHRQGSGAWRLERFKQLIETRDEETGAWRGEVQEGETVVPTSARAVLLIRGGARAATSGDVGAAGGAVAFAELGQAANRVDGAPSWANLPSFTAGRAETVVLRRQYAGGKN